MFSLLLAIIYLAFISLGLPDALLGSGWPVMGVEFDVPISYAGIITMLIAGGTIISSLLSDRMTRKFGPGGVTAISVSFTALALLGFSFAGSFITLCLLAIPYGFGAGAVDAALNNYVALHYESRHMSWLHCFWGVGASIGPYVMGWALSNGNNWRAGYGVVSGIQLALTVCLFLSLPLWKKHGAQTADDAPEKKVLSLADVLRIPGVKAVLILFFAYCSFEATTFLWASSYLVGTRGLSEETAATMASLACLGITVGRFFCGFITDRLGDRKMICIGSWVILAGIALILLPSNSAVPTLIGLAVIGFGAAPVYPSVIHATPEYFGKENSHAIVGVQMASAYTGSTFLPPIFGLLAQHISLSVYPFFLLFFVLLMMLAFRRVKPIAHA